MVEPGLVAWRARGRGCVGVRLSRGFDQSASQSQSRAGRHLSVSIDIRWSRYEASYARYVSTYIPNILP